MSRPPDRRTAFEDVLRDGVAELLEISAADVDVTAPLTEMGADSLIMVAAARSVQQLYGLKIAMRRFFEDLDTIQALAAYLDRVLPAEAAPQRLTSAALSTAAAVDTTPAPVASRASATESRPGGSDPDAVNATLLQQLNVLSTVMLEQLRVLEGHAGNGRAPAAPPAEVAEDGPPPAASPPVLVRRYALTPEQQELWTAAQIETDASVAINNRVALRLRGVFDAGALQRAVDQVVLRHEGLRTTFSDDGREGLVFDRMPVEVAVLDVSDVEPDDRETLVEECLQADARFPFDRLRGPLVRVQLVRRAADDHLLLLSSDHVIADGYSMALLLDDLATAYRGERDGGRAQQAPALPFSEYAAWRAALAPEDVEAARAFWVRQLDSSVGVLDLPYDRARPVAKTYPGDRTVAALDSATAAAIAAVCRAEHCTPQMVLLAAFSTLLHRLSSHDDIIVGLPFAMRTVVGSETTFGNCTNLGAVRTHLDGDPTFRALIGRVRTSLLDAFEHGHVALTRLPRRLPAGVRPSVGARLYTTYFNVDPHPRNLDFRCEVSWQPCPTPFCHPDLFFNLVGVPDGYMLEVQFNTDLLDAATARRWTSHFLTLLADALADPDRRLSELALLSADERAALSRAAACRAGGTAEAVFHVLDRHGVPAPIGVVAMLHREHDGTTRPTGALARRTANGSIDPLGPAADHVRVHGFLVDRARLTRAIEALSVADVAIAAEPGRLIAYVVPGDDDAGTPSAWRARVSDAVPDLIVPEVMLVDAIPRGDDGAPDWIALAETASAESARTSDTVAPRSELEQQLVAIWEDVLDVRGIGVRDSFFELGGHSLLLIHLIGRVRNRYAVDFPLTEFVTELTIERMAELIEQPVPAVTPAQSVATMLFGAAPSPGNGGPPPTVHLLAGDSLTIGTSGAFGAPSDLADDVTLDPEIRVEHGRRPVLRADPRVLLTGATGFVGAFLLHELLERTTAEVHCLVRSVRRKDATERIREALQHYGLWEPRHDERIVALPGNVAKARFGLAESAYRKLAGTIDVVYHAAAVVNFLFPYRTVRGTNVGGTREILRFAVEEQLKAVHYISTLGVFPPIVPTGTTFGEDDPLATADGILAGYPQSKWVADKIVGIARSRGVPVTTYRVGRVTGHSRSGACSPTDLWSTAVHCCIALGAAPAIAGAIEMAPADWVSRALVHLAQQPDSLGRVFHVCNPDRLPLAELVQALVEFGHPVEQLPERAWRDRLLERSRGARDDSPFAHIALFEQLAPGIVGKLLTNPATFDCSNTNAALSGAALPCPRADRSLVQTYLAFFERMGLIEPPRGRRPVASPRAPEATVGGCPS
jgi:thioester reductase-like protein